MTRIPVLVAAFALLVLAGCQPSLTLEEARLLCTKQGGFLVVIHTQKITMSGVGQDVESPGNCIAASKFEAPTSNDAPSPAK